MDAVICVLVQVIYNFDENYNENYDDYDNELRGESMRSILL